MTPGPPEHSNAPENVKERFEERDDGTVVDHGDAQCQREQQCEQLRESVDWSNAPDWARLLHLEVQQIRESE
jgi:hypothetical protein